VRSYVELSDDPWRTGDAKPLELIEQLRTDASVEHHPAVMHALQAVIESEPTTGTPETRLLSDLPGSH
jgi:hypothetical protein